MKLSFRARISRFSRHFSSSDQISNLADSILSGDRVALSQSITLGMGFIMLYEKCSLYLRLLKIVESSRKDHKMMSEELISKLNEKSNNKKHHSLR